ncbi:DUF262 domain-containing protein [Methylocystis rosea]|uniref:DUF262 domain-containing protein n=1 Tax=Methylocystis rosea TaxID=173366 RepID=UPI00037A5A89|nr:DUF262 domain-containing protein [Methylocystis rosea]
MATDASVRGFDFSSMGIGSVLKLHRLKVPPYQREYAWDTEEVQQLFADFSNAKFENKDYFLGTIVTISNPSSKVLEIVDGQQRLTTTAILISAIRNYLSTITSANIIVESINNEFLSTIDRVAGQRVPRLALNIDDNAFFECLIDHGSQREKLPPTRESHRLLINASNIAKLWVENAAKQFAVADVPSRFNDWIEFIETNATVVLLQAQNASQAFKMFETLNDRGMKTNQADLVKSYLFGQSDKRIAEAIAKWSSVRDNLEEMSDDDRLINFLRHVFIATRNFVRAEDIYEETQKTVRGDANAATFLSELERLSRVYVATYRTDSEFWTGHPAATTKALRIINKFDIKPVRPLVLALALEFPQNELAEAFRLVLSITVRLLIASATRSGTNEQTFAAAALSVFKKETNTVAKLRTILGRVIVSDSDFRDTFAAARSSKADYARYYLRSIEAAYAKDSEPWFVLNDDEASITLEHVLPKNRMAGTWPTFSEEDAERFGKRLGNLCLLQRTPNSTIDNDSFDAKKPALRVSPYHFTNHISDFDTWSSEKIEERQAHMAEWAILAWPI